MKKLLFPILAGILISHSARADEEYAAPTTSKASTTPAKSTAAAAKKPPAKTYKLKNLYDGTARFQTPAESEIVGLKDALAPDVNPLDFLSKFPTFQDPASKDYYAFTRVLRAAPKEERYDVMLFRSKDGGRNFEAVGTITHRTETENYYDPQLVIDTTVNPPNYILTIECSDTKWPTKFADACILQSTTPTKPDSWSKPKRILIGCGGVSADGSCPGNDQAISASTAALVQDGKDFHLSWTSLELPKSNWAADDNRTYSSSAPIKSFTSLLGYANQGSRHLDAEPNTHCTSAWDCNNRNTQDWRKEENYFYLLYNGANYFACTRPETDKATNEWGIAITRSTSASGAYAPANVPVLKAEKNNTCGISYGHFDEVEGEMYIYFPYRDAAGAQTLRRSKLIAGASGLRDMPPPTPGTDASPSCKNKNHASANGEEFLEAAYCSILGRAPDASGKKTWMNELANGAERAQVLASLLVSQEAVNRAGPATATNAGFVKLLYKTLLGREVDASGLASSLAALDAGMPRRNLVVEFFKSAEPKAYWGMP